MSLVLEIEFLTGVCRAARDPAREEPDWPPQPDRVFSALVAAWAFRGQHPEERKALRWLEAATVPAIHASGHTERSAPECYVRPNDFQTPAAALDRQRWYRDFLYHGRRPPKKGGHEKPWRAALSTLPEYRQGKPRRFQVARPDDPVMALVWPEEPESTILQVLDALASDVAYLGHSTSLVRCRFLRGGAEPVRHPAATAHRRVYPGRLEQLEAAHRAKPVRPDIAPGASVREVIPKAERESVPVWLVLEAIKGDVPDIRASALVCRALRRALMAGYRRAGLDGAIPEVVSGHSADGAPTLKPHLAIVPLAFAGFRYADGRVFGLAVLPPAGMVLQDIPGFRRAFAAIAPYHPGSERRVLELAGTLLPKPLRLAPAGVTAVRSLSPQPYLRPARIWASVTPIVLDRHLKRKSDGEVRAIVAGACERAGLPRPDLERVRVGKHSAVEGAPPARPPAGAPPWTRWKVPEPFATRKLVHAMIDFGREVPGPVLLGAGRFTGLGLCRGWER